MTFSRGSMLLSLTMRDHVRIQFFTNFIYIHSFSSIMGPKPVWLVPFKAPPHWAFNAFGAAPPPKRPPAAAIPVRPGVDGGPPFKAPPPYPAVEAPQPPPPPLADAVHRYVLRIICRACSEGYPHNSLNHTNHICQSSNNKSLFDDTQLCNFEWQF